MSWRRPRASAAASHPHEPEQRHSVAAGTEFLGARFDDPVYKLYSALELTLNRRGSNWSTMTSYRFSRLRGNFEGFYRDDNGQSDPGISSLYDFPTNDPSYAPFYAGLNAGDIRYLGDPDGILPLDRPHQVKLYGNYAWNWGLNLGGGLNLRRAPLTPMAANPNYGSDGEIPVGPWLRDPDGRRLQGAHAVREPVRHPGVVCGAHGW